MDVTNTSKPILDAIWHKKNACYESSLFNAIYNYLSKYMKVLDGKFKYKFMKHCYD
jgi:hypothetical protein